MGRGFKSFLVQACVHSIVRYESRPGSWAFSWKDPQERWLPKLPAPPISLLNCLDQPGSPVFPAHCSSSCWEMMMSLAWIEAGWDPATSPASLAPSHRPTAPILTILRVPLALSWLIKVCFPLGDPAGCRSAGGGVVPSVSLRVLVLGMQPRESRPGSCPSGASGNTRALPSNLPLPSS